MDDEESAFRTHRSHSVADPVNESFPWPETPPNPRRIAVNMQWPSEPATLVGDASLLPEMHTASSLDQSMEKLVLSEGDVNAGANFRACRSLNSGAEVPGLAGVIPPAQNRGPSTPKAATTESYGLQNAQSLSEQTVDGLSTPAGPSLRPGGSCDHEGRSSRRGSKSPAHKRRYVIEYEEAVPEGNRHTVIKTTTASSKALLLNLSRVLEISPLHEQARSQLHALYSRSQNLLSFDSTASTTVGLVGDSGAGKSLLVNSLLDERLARADSSGFACTCVATEYHYHEHDNFVISVDYFTVQECQEQFAQLLQALRAPSTNAEDDDENQNPLARIARETFAAVFPGLFEQNEASLYQADEVEALRTLLDWVESLEVPLKERPSNESIVTPYPNAKDCAAGLIELTSITSDKNQKCSWPFIRRLRVYLKAIILSEGLVLVDLPGLRDCSPARREISERCLRQCDEVFVVCPVARAATDQSVKDIFTLAKKAALSRVGIVCTKSDDFKSDEYKSGTDKQEKKAIEDFEAAIKAAEVDVAQAKDQLRGTSDDDSDIDNDANLLTPERILELERRRRQAEKRVIQLTFKLQCRIASHRNARVTKQLQHAYGTRIANRDTQIFCVSNEYYWKNRHQDQIHSRDYVRLSNIPDLRQFCLSIVPENQLRATTSYLQNEIPVLLEDLRLWTESGSAVSSTGETRKAILSILDDLEQELHKLTLPTSNTETSLHDLRRDFNDNVSHLMRRKTSECTRQALESANDWRGIHHSTYAAFCRHSGVFRNKKVDRDWNEEAMAHLFTAMKDPWNEFQERILNNLTAVERDIALTIKNATAKAELSAPLAEALPILAVTMRRRSDTIQSALHQLEADFQKELDTLTVDVFGSVQSSYFCQLMEPNYKKARNEYGDGSWRRRMRIIESAFENTQLMSTIQQHFSDRFLELFSALHTNIQRVIEGNINSSRDLFAALRSENTVAESEEDNAFRAMVIEVVAASSEEITRLARMVAP